MPSLLVILIVLPAAAAAMLLLLDAKAPPVRARWAALLATLATFLVSLGVASQFLSINRSGIEGTSPVHAQMGLSVGSALLGSAMLGSAWSLNSASRLGL